MRVHVLTATKHLLDHHARGLASLAEAQQAPATLICEIHTLRTLLHQALWQLQCHETRRRCEEQKLRDVMCYALKSGVYTIEVAKQK